MEHTFGLTIGGISEDDKLVAPGQVLYSENLDLTSNSDFITLAPKPESLFIHTDTGNINAMYYLRRGKDILITSTDDGYIYVGGTYKFTPTGGVTVFWSNSEYLFWLDDTQNVHYIALTYIFGSWAGNIQTGSIILEVDDSSIYVIETQDLAYITYGTYIYIIDNTNGNIVDEYNFLYDRVVGITLIAGTIKIFQRDGRVFLWDGLSTAPAQGFNLSVAVSVVQQSSNEEYLVGEGALYKLVGMDLQKIGSAFNSDKLQQSKFRFKRSESNTVGFLKQMNYVGGDIIGTIQDTANVYQFGLNAPIITYGVKKSGFPIALNNWITGSSDGSGYATIHGVKTRATDFNGFNDTLYIAHESKDGQIGVDEVDLDVQNYTCSGNNGLLIYETFDGGNKTIEKKLNRIKIRADFQNNAGSFIFFNLKDGTLYPINTNITKSTIGNKIGEGLYELIVQTDMLDITLAVVFVPTASRSKNSAMKLYSITLYYESIKR